MQEFYSIVEFCNPGILGNSIGIHMRPSRQTCRTITIGSASAFRKVYEEPIVASRQPTATIEEKVMGEARASQVCIGRIKLYIMYILCVSSGKINSFDPPSI